MPRYVRHAKRSSRAELLAANLRKRPAQPAAPAEVAPWPLKASPAAYLALHPDGKHAPLARAIVAQGG